jgi:peptidoglycan/LPS O-acetylase OafA/YrhL
MEGKAVKSARLESATYIPAIDGLRAISILGVMASHGVNCLTPIFGEAGWFGVNIFFVISGFLITRLALAEISSSTRFEIRRFYLRRFLRICPALWCLLFFYALVNPFHLAVNRSLSSIAIAAAFLTDYDLAFNWGHSLNSGLEFCWSLGVEEKFYLVFPLLLTLRPRVPIHLVFLFALIVVQIWRTFVVSTDAELLRLSSAFDTRCGEILVGCYAASLLSFQERIKKLVSILGNSLSSLLLFAGLWYWMRCMFHLKDYVDVSVARSLWLYLTPLLVISVALLLMSFSIAQASGGSNFVAKILSVRPLVWIGKLSYSMYLWHTVAFLYVRTVMGDSGITSDLAKILLTVLIAAMSYYLIERPFLSLKNRWQASG